MSDAQLTIVLCTLFAILGYWRGRHVGAARQRKKWGHLIDKYSRYRSAVDALDCWCGHGSPHARLIARHLIAKGEGLEMNAGTPCADEACTIAGLREQLRRVDAERDQLANTRPDTAPQAAPAVVKGDAQPDDDVALLNYRWLQQHVEYLEADGYCWSYEERIKAIDVPATFHAEMSEARVRMVGIGSSKQGGEA